jgi:hypothetical protein
MKRNVLIGALVWTLLISAIHVSLNVGWARFADELKFWSQDEREELVVGFLPVT